MDASSPSKLRKRTPLVDCTNTILTPRISTRFSSSSSKKFPISDPPVLADSPSVDSCSSRSSTPDGRKDSTSGGSTPRRRKMNTMSGIEPCVESSNRKVRQKCSDDPSSSSQTTHQKPWHWKRGMTEEVVEEQRSYFAEIDAFQLLEEEVESFSELD